MTDDGKKAAGAKGARGAPARVRNTKKSAKPAKPRAGRSRHDKVDNPVVFAFRLSATDRKRIHDAAGSAKASRFVLAAALAAADGDVEAFKRVVDSRATK